MRLRGRGRPPETCVQRLAAPGVCRRCAPSPEACRPTAVGGLFLPPLPHSPASVDTAGAFFMGNFLPDGLTTVPDSGSIVSEAGFDGLFAGDSSPRLPWRPASFFVFWFISSTLISSSNTSPSGVRIRTACGSCFAVRCTATAALPRRPFSSARAPNAPLSTPPLSLCSVWPSIHTSRPPVLLPPALRHRPAHRRWLPAALLAAPSAAFLLSSASMDTAGAFSGKFSPDGLTFRSFGSILFLESGCPILLCSLSRPVRAPDSFSVFTSAVGYEKEGWSSRRRSGGRGIAVKIPVMVGIISRRKASFSALHPACLTAPEREKPWLTRRRRSDIIVFTGLDGEMAEWLKALVLKTSDVERHRGFESLSLRQRAWRSTQEAQGAPLLRE